jgi:hypothetical protein
MLSLEIDDSEGQTKNVLRKVAQVEGLNHSTALIDYKPWQDFQRWLERGERRVVVPFAEQLIELIPPAAVRLRRDVGQVLRAIKAHALIHREQRLRDDAGQIIADIEKDYETVGRLLEPILAEGSGVAVNPAMTETIDAVAKATASLSEAEGASAQDIARVLKLDKSAAWRRLSAARHEGFVFNLEQRKGMPGKYRATAQRKGEAVAILPATDKLREAIANTSSSTPLKSVQPCNREEKTDSPQDNNGCMDGCSQVDNGCAIDGGCNEPATAYATVKPLDVNGKSLPVVRLQGFSGGYAAQGTCDAANGDGTTTEDDLGIPPFLRRANEPATARITIRAIRHPAISSGPDDDLGDFTISGGPRR